MADMPPYVNPSNITLYAKYESADSFTLYMSDTSKEGYSGISIEYIDANGLTYPSSTTINIQSRSDSPYTVKKITTTAEGGNRVKKEWTADNGVFSYGMKSDFIGSALHTVNFNVLWSNGEGHDPKIVINPT